MADRDDELTMRDEGGDASDTANTAALRAEISETRERMGDTIEQIGERLNPSNLKAQVKEDIREATIGRVETMAHNAAERVDETRRTITDTIRENPIPAAMVGIGLGWLIINGRRHNGHDDSFEQQTGGAWRAGTSGYGQHYRGGYGYDTRGTGGYASGYAGDYGGSGQRSGYASGGAEEEGKLEHVRERASQLGETVRDKASELGENLSESAHDLAERTQEVVGDVAHRAQDVYGNVARTTRRQARRVEDSFYENPLLVGALTLSAGLAIGLAMPRTRRESQLMGEWRDDLVDRARDVASETKEKVQHVAERTFEEAKDTAKEAAEDEGLTS